MWVEVWTKPPSPSTSLHALPAGPLLGFPVQDVNVCVKELRVSEGAPLPALCGCLSQAVLKVHIHKHVYRNYVHFVDQALKEADMSILEPLTDLEVYVHEGKAGS